MSLGEKEPSEILGELQGRGDEYTKLSVGEKKRQVDLEDAIDYIKRESEKYRTMARTAAVDVMNLHIITPNPSYTRADGVDIAKQASQSTFKVLNILEVKLNKLLQRKSEVINENKQIKHEINHFRRLRLQTDITHAKFEATLRECKDSIEQRLSEATQVMEERDKLMEKKESLERAHTEEQRTFQEEYDDKGIYIREQNRALDESLLRERKESDKTSKNVASGTDPLIESVRGGATLDEEVEMARQVGSLDSFVQTEQNSLSGIQDKIATYEMIFEQLKKITGTDSLKEVVSTYMADEEEMFSLYNYIQTVNAEIDQTTELSYQTEQEISVYREQQKQQEFQRESILNELKAKLQTTLESVQQQEELNKQSQDSVAQISKKVSSLFYKLQCDQADSKVASATSRIPKGTNMTRPDSKIGLLAAGQGVSESNVLEFMGSIEQRALDIISDYLRATQDPGASTSRRNNISPTPGPTSPMSWPMEAKVSVDEFDDEDVFTDGPDTEGESKPIDLEAFKEKMKRKLTSATNTNTSTAQQAMSNSNTRTRDSAFDRGFPRK